MPPHTPHRADKLLSASGLPRCGLNHGLVLVGLLIASFATAHLVGIELVRDHDTAPQADVSFFAPLLIAAVAAAVATFWHPEERLIWAVLAAGLALGAATEATVPLAREGGEAPTAAAVAYGLFCATCGAAVLTASGNFRVRRAFAQGLGVCALGLATLWAWFFLGPAATDGSAGETVHSALDLLLALAVLAAFCNHGWPAASRFAMLGAGFGLLAVADSMHARGALSAVAGLDLADALPFVGAALIAMVACTGMRPDRNRERSGRLVVIVSVLSVAAAIATLLYDHYDRLSSGAVLLASLTLLAAGVQLIVAQRGWRDARARAHRVEVEAATEAAGLDAALTVGRDGRIASCNELAYRVLRRGELEIVGKPVGNLLDGGSGERSFEELLATTHPEAGKPLSVEVTAYDTHGVGFPVEIAIGPQKAASGLRTLLVRDISERRRREEENRRLAAIIRSSDDAVLTKDLSGTITSWNRGAERLYGYTAAEAVGRHVSELIIPAERRGEAKRVLAEVSGGETISFETQRVTKSGTVMDVSLRAFPIRGISGEVTAVCTVGHDVSDRRRRERAEARDTEALLWRRRLREAIDNGDLLFHGQPVLDLGSGSVHHHELLVRMCLDGEMVPPGSFLPYAEETELIRDLDLWAVEEGMRLGARVPVAINLSARSLGSHGLLTAIERRLGEDLVDPGNLTFEITETAAAENMRGANELVGELTEMGCAVALDDFGTGYGSFTYLRHLPVTQLKIDIEFIRGIGSDAADRRVVESMVAVARNFEMTTVAEGVEDGETLNLLAELGIDFAQGYHVGRPRPLEFEMEPS